MIASRGGGKVGKSVSLRPADSLEYVVKNSDTLESIAARHDCMPSELMKLNKLHSRMVFPGQVLFVPDGSSHTAVNRRNSESVVEKNYPDKPVVLRQPSGSFTDGEGVRHYEAHEGSDLRNRKLATLPLAHVHQPQSAGKGLIGSIIDSSGMRPGTKGKFVTVVEEDKTASSSSTATTPAATPLDDDLDVECLQRFLKLSVKQFTDNEGVVNGVLLVTPNCVMFDPDLNHPLVRENGAEKYGMIAKMDEIISAALYTDVTALVQSQQQQTAEKADAAALQDQQQQLRDSVFYGSGEHSEAKMTPTGLQPPANETHLAESANRFFLGGDQTTTDDLLGSQQRNVPDRLRSFSDSSATGDDDHSHKMASTPLTSGPNFVPGSLPDIPELASPQKPPPIMARLVDSPIVTAPLSDGETSRESQKTTTAEVDEQPKPVDLLHLPHPVGHGKRHLSDPGGLDVVKTESEDGGSGRSRGTSSDDSSIRVASLEDFDVGQFVRHASCPPSLDKGRPTIRGGLSEDLPVFTDGTEPRKQAGLAETSAPRERTESVPTEPTTGHQESKGFLRGRMRSLHGGLNLRKSMPILRGGGATVKLRKKKSEGHKATKAETDEGEDHAASPRPFSGFKRSLSKKANSISGAVGGVISSGAQTVGGAIQSSAQSVGGAITTGAQTVGGALTTGAQTVGGAISSGAQNVGGAISTGAQSVGGALSTGAASVGDVISTGAQSLASMPRNIVNMSSGLFVDENLSSSSYGAVRDISESRFDQNIRRQKSYAKLEELKTKAGLARTQAAHNLKLSFTCATSKDERPDLFTPIEEMLPPLMSPNTELPFFLCIRLNRKRKKSVRTGSGAKSPTAQQLRDDEAFLVFGDLKKSEFWFTVPRDKADNLYMFFLQWSPEKYGDAVTDGQTEDDIRPKRQLLTGDHEGFVIIDAEEHDYHLKDDSASQPSSFVAGSYLNLNREWEIVTVEEVKRRLSLLDEIDVSKFPLPEGSTESKVLSEQMIRQIVSILPARAEGYPWNLIYSTTEHGFSLRTLYRKMSTWYVDMSPSLIIVMDTSQHVFGAIVSCPLRVAEHFYGSGESKLFTFHPEFTEWTWTGENNYFCKGSQQSLSVGAGSGRFGLWLDGDLYHGRTQRCDTFNNEPLTNSEDFLIQHVEVWGFSMI